MPRDCVACTDWACQALWRRRDKTFVDSRKKGAKKWGLAGLHYGRSHSSFSSFSLSLSLCKLNFLPLPLPLGQAKPFSRLLSDLILLASSSSPPQNAGGGRGQKRNGEGLSPTSIFSLIFPPFPFCPFFSEELGGKFAERACLYRFLFCMTAFFAGECDPRIFHSAFSLLFPPFSAPPSVSLFSDV